MEDGSSFCGLLRISKLQSSGDVIKSTKKYLYMTTYLPSMNKKDDIYFLIRRNNRKLLRSEKIFSCNKYLSKLSVLE